jgi:hypothetical protein
MIILLVVVDYFILGCIVGMIYTEKRIAERERWLDPFKDAIEMEPGE